MIDCPLQLVDGKWTCPQCGWVYKLKSDKPPKRNCPKAPPMVDRVLASVRERLDKATTCTAAEWGTIEARVRVCCGCPFGKFAGGTCQERGSDCEKFNRWFERLAIGCCGCWEALPADDGSEYRQSQGNADDHANDSQGHA